ncbi:hypothetical protein LEP1GSC126_3384 [Leptospira kirschneri str. 200801774]|uniref:hypothetical protein n=1 Tax=Leptospira kirschneri TaxID=29507 RepID=UPI0002BE6234|nr:hypothetical protein [Leptospira kirschneri]EMO80186.1 hypothetical protein LEP1GSC126_3384 [Leptospira kirschneri str. 200801774]
MTEDGKLEINDIFKLIEIESEISGADYVESINSFDAIGDLESLLGNISDTPIDWFDAMVDLESLLGNISDTGPNDDYHIAMGLIVLSTACITYASKVNQEELKQLFKDQFRDQVSEKIDFKNILEAMKETCGMSFVLNARFSDFGRFQSMAKANLTLLCVSAINKDDYILAKVLIVTAAACAAYATSLNHNAVKRLIKDRYIDNILNEGTI